MKKFLLSLVIYSSIVFGVMVIGFFLPATPRAKTSLLFAKIDKDSLLKNTPSPRIIFIGGSNLSFGLNSQMIKDSLGLNPINTAINASLGLMYMLEHSLPYIKKGDIVVVAPEYSNYFGDAAYGREEMFRTALDVEGLKGLSTLSCRQFYNALPFIPKYCLSKFSVNEYRGFVADKIYSRNSFNKYGDVNAHWDMKATKVKPNGGFSAEVNEDVIPALQNYQAQLQQIGARLFVSFPGYQEASYNKSKSKLIGVELRFKHTGIAVLGSPLRYTMPDSLIFNTVYHLTRQGAVRRTTLLIEDLRNALHK